MEKENDIEIWLPIKNFEELYEVSNLGNVRSFNTKSKNKSKDSKKGVLLKLRLDKKGYYKVVLCKNGNKAYKTVHRLVADTFIPNPNNLPQVNHINCIKTDNRVENLEHVSSRDNLLHAFSNRLNKGRSKLTDDIVTKIRILRDNGYQYKTLSEMFNISKSSVRYACIGETWKHLKQPPCFSSHYKQNGFNPLDSFTL